MPRRGSRGHLGIPVGGVRAALSWLGGSQQRFCSCRHFGGAGMLSEAFGIFGRRRCISQEWSPNYSAVSGWAERTVGVGSCPSQDF